MTFSAQDHGFMQRAIELAQQAAGQQEVPVGAVIVHNHQIIAEAYNQPIASKDPSAHAEIIALRRAAEALDNYRLLDTILYVTLEPCLMCVGAMVHARIKRLVFGATDLKAGAVDSVYSVLNDNKLNHRITWQGGLLQVECGKMLVDFFQQRR